MQLEVMILGAGITIFSFNLLLVSLLSYIKFRHTKLLLTGFVFLLFFVKGVVLSLSLFFEQIEAPPSLLYLWLFDLLILVLLYVISLKR